MPDTTTPSAPRPAAPEQRTATVEVENVRTEGKTLHGFACLYGAESRDLGGFTERIEPGAFTGALAADPDVLLTFNHSPDKVLARTRSGTLKLSDEARGLAFEAELGDGPTAQDVRDMVRRGDLSGASFRFVVAPDGETWEGERRTLTKVAELIDVSLAVTPAYDGPTVELRTRPENTSASAGTNAASERQENENMPDLNTETRNEAPETAGGRSSEQRAGGGLAVEDRAQQAEQRSVEDRLGDALREVRKGESRALTTSATISPGELATTLFDRLRAASVGLASGIRVLTTDKDSVVYPALTADVVPAWYAEAAAITPGDPTFSSVTATPRKLAHLVQMSNEVIDDSDPSIVDVLNAHLLRVLALKLDLGIFEGSGIAPEVRGLKNVAGIQTVTNVGANGGALANLDAIADAIGLLETVNTTASAIVMPPRTYNVVRKLKTTTNEYLVADSPTVGTPQTLFGVPIYVSGQLSTTETQGTAVNSSSIYVFNAAEVVYVRRSEVELELDRSRLFNSDQSELRAKLRGDLIVPNPTAVVRVVGVTP